MMITLNSVDAGRSIVWPRMALQLSAAVALLLMAIAAPSALSLLKSSTSSWMVRVAVFLFLVVAVIDVVAAWAFFHLFKGTSRGLSTLTMIFRVVYAALLVASLGGYYPVVSGPDDAVDLAGLYQQFDRRWAVALLFFGVHLVLLGPLIMQSRLFHGVLGILVLVSGLGYAFDAVVKLFFPGAVVTVSLYTFVGEALLIFWLPINAFRLFRSSGQRNQPAQNGES